MKLYINDQMVLPVLGSLTLRKTRSEAAATLTATLYIAPADTYFLNLTLSLGDQVLLLDDADNEVFLGSIHELQRIQEAVRITAYDLGICLTRNELQGVFSGSPAGIATRVAAMLGLSVGTMEVPGGWKHIVSRSGQSAFFILRQAVGDKREISLRKGRLCITKSAYMVYPLEPSQVLNAESRVSLADMINRCETTDRKGNLLKTAENSTDIARYGQMQTILSGSDIDPSAALCGIAATGKVTVMGNTAFLCGCAIEIHRSEWGLDGVYAITAAEHHWEKGQYTSTLNLELVR